MKRKIREAIAIKRENPSLNRDQGLDLPKCYLHLLCSRDHHQSRDIATVTTTNPVQAQHRTEDEPERGSKRLQD